MPPPIGHRLGPAGPRPGLRGVSRGRASTARVLGRVCPKRSVAAFWLGCDYWRPAGSARLLARRDLSAAGRAGGSQAERAFNPILASALEPLQDPGLYTSLSGEQPPLVEEDEDDLARDDERAAERQPR